MERRKKTRERSAVARIINNLRQSCTLSFP
jgi:hypothetical protein